jgi:hypothetical protein
VPPAADGTTPGVSAAVASIQQLPAEDGRSQVEFVNAGLGFHRHLVDSVGSERLSKLYAIVTRTSNEIDSTKATCANMRS